MKLINKSALVAEIERQISAIDNCPKLTGTQIAVLEGNKVVLTKLLSFINTLEVREVDLELIIGWFDHIAQIADDRMTLTNQRMTDTHALDEIKCLAKNSSEFITKHYKAQKGEEV